MPGKIKSGLGALIGNAGEYYVVAELLKREVVAALAPRNAPGFDVLATKGGRTARIRVKTKSAEQKIWQWNARKDGLIFRELSPTHDDDFTVLVTLAEKRDEMSFYVVPTIVLESWLDEDFTTWLSTPGKRKPRDAKNNKKRHLSFPRWAAALEQYREAWGLPWKVQNAATPPTGGDDLPLGVPA
ncbi:MAG: hypothetical protein IPK82_12885 [Polyangiaceae bacterium]|nr:hypothetical protein [Polyangiaceae bacterium]